MKIPTSSRTPQRGFTLIELLAVIAILAVLVTLIVPGIRDMRVRAGSAGCLNNLRQIGVASQSYAADHDNYVAGSQGGWVDWADPLSPYLSSDGKSLSEGAHIPGAYMCPGEKQTGDLGIYRYLSTSYSLNVQFFYSVASGGYSPIKYINILHPAKTVYLGDTLFFAGAGDGGWPRSSWHGPGANHLSNLLMFDGHAETVKIVSEPYGALWSGEKPDSTGRLQWFNE